MAYTTPLENYVRSLPPQTPEGQLRYLQEELKKLERVIKIMGEALEEAEARLTSGGI